MSRRKYTPFLFARSWRMRGQTRSYLAYKSASSLGVPGRHSDSGKIVFATVWTVEQCIAVAPAYLAGPTRVYTLTHEGGACVAARVGDDVLQEHRQAVADARDSLRRWRILDAPAPAPPS